jgi:serine/threonine-protein kinase
MSIEEGSRLGTYEILAPIGAGGMGEVYRARDTKLKREVAIKVLPEHLAKDPQALARFEQEAQAVAALAHPNILAIYDFGQEQRISYAVTELLEGETLRARLESGSIPIRKSIDYALQVARGLAAAHERGIIHRDLKPENVFVTHEGHLKILDFGLAKVTPAAEEEAPTRSRHTEPGTVMGTVGYMSPEQVRGQSVDQRTDIFSFGAILYEMLSGRRAFQADTAADTMSAILKEEPTELTELETSVSPALDAMVQRCLEKNPLERFQSARDLGFALQSITAEKKDSDAARAAHVSGDEEIPSIAVLPFANMSSDAEQEYFCEGMAEEIINALTQIEGLRVAARMSTFQFKGKTEDARRVGDALNVKMLLEGSVRTAGNRLRVTAQLINARDGYQLWSERYDREMEDVFAIQDEITSQIVGALKVRLGDQDVPRIKRHTDNLEAYHLYLKAKHFWFQRQPAAQRKALQIYQQAAEKDPSYAPAHAGIGWIYCIIGLYGLIPPDRAHTEIKTAVERAFSLDDSLTDVQVGSWAFNYFYGWNWEEAERTIKRAIGLEPTHVEAHCFYGLFLASWGRHEEATAEARRAQELDPLSTYANSIAGMVFSMAGENVSAAVELQKALDIDPDFVLGLHTLAGVQVRKSNYGEAIAVLDRVITITGRAPFYIATLGWAYGAAGQQDQAREILRELMERSEKEYVSPLYIAWILRELEDEAAFEWLEKAHEEHCPYIAFHRFPMFDGLRSDPRFDEILRRLDIPT